ncbi:hypothetical protein [Methylobacter sp.]|uniref:hypothetical protein n=1 Tax=Methylobacter sp. TaxID=2051955 RepID=UPI002FDE9F2B
MKKIITSTLLTLALASTAQAQTQSTHGATPTYGNNGYQAPAGTVFHFSPSVAAVAPAGSTIQNIIINGLMVWNTADTNANVHARIASFSLGANAPAECGTPNTIGYYDFHNPPAGCPTISAANQDAPAVTIIGGPASTLGSIYINANANVHFTLSGSVPAGYYDLQTNFAHEFGHVLGLGHQYSPANAVTIVNGVVYAVNYSGTDTGTGTCDNGYGSNYCEAAVLNPPPGRQTETMGSSNWIYVNQLPCGGSISPHDAGAINAIY